MVTGEYEMMTEKIEGCIDGWRWDRTRDKDNYANTFILL